MTFDFFKENGITNEILRERLQINFDETRCISANNEEEKDKNQKSNPHS